MFLNVFTAAIEGRLKDLKDLLDHLPQQEVSRLLLDKETNGNGSLLDKYKLFTLLGLSCWNGRKEVVEYIVDKCPASVEQTGTVTIYGKRVEGATPLWFATVQGHLDIVKMLVKRGANVNSKTNTNSTALQAACYHGHYEIVKYLVESDLIEMGTDDNKCIHFCAENGRLDIIKLLLILGARIDEEIDGMTPVKIASLKGHGHIVEYLISQRELVSKQERLDALELLGAYFVDKKHDLIGAADLWKRTTEERKEKPVIPKTPKKSPNTA